MWTREKDMIGIIDYGAGNLRSVKKALDYLEVESKIIQTPYDFDGMSKIILPGVGAFGAAIETLKAQALYEPIQTWLAADNPFLGICLGLQMLFEESEEAGGIKGFGIFKGRIPQFTEGKVPQIGWNQVKYVRETPLFANIADNSFFYFLHGYFVETGEQNVVIGETEYGIRYTSAIARGNIYAVQFHPEKSGKLGRQLLQNWVNLC
jgi:imidazole glycerol phosphate synthase glutamine amidotransferase subunit